MSGLLFNFPLVAALAGIVFAQVIKVPVHLVLAREFAPGLVFGTGSMPSSHSAAVCALTTAVGIVEGLDSVAFAMAFVFSVIIMFDATGIRRAAGEHAVILNRMVKDFQVLGNFMTDWTNKDEYERTTELKTLLGHKPIEVFVGALTGIAIAFIIYPFYT